MKKTLAGFLAAATIAATLAATATDARPSGEGADGADGAGADPALAPALRLASSAAPSSPAPSLPRGLPATWSTQAMRSRSTRPAATGRPSRLWILPVASSAIPANRCKSARATRGLRRAMWWALPRALRSLVRPVALPAPATRPGHPALPVVRLLTTRPPTARSATDHTIREAEPIWATTAYAIRVRDAGRIDRRSPRMQHDAAKQVSRSSIICMRLGNYGSAAASRGSVCGAFPVRVDRPRCAGRCASMRARHAR